MSKVTRKYQITIPINVRKTLGINPIFKGKMGIDATWKKGYPAPLVMSDEIVKKVDERWDSYWK